MTTEAIPFPPPSVTAVDESPGDIPALLDNDTTAADVARSRPGPEADPGHSCDQVTDGAVAADPAAAPDVLGQDESSSLGPAFAHGFRCLVALQAEALMRSVGVMASHPGAALEAGAWIEREARDLSALAAVAVANGAALPPGMDHVSGGGGNAAAVLNGMLAARTAVADTVRDLLARCTSSPAHSWVTGILAGILERREEEIRMLRSLGADGELPEDEMYVRGSLPGA